MAAIQGLESLKVTFRNRKKAMLTIAQIADTAASGMLGTLSDTALADACHSVLFARDPAHLGEEPHLRCVVDACGIGDDALAELDQALWAEASSRHENRHAACWQTAPAITALAA